MGFYFYFFRDFYVVSRLDDQFDTVYNILDLPNTLPFNFTLYNDCNREYRWNVKIYYRQILTKIDLDEMCLTRFRRKNENKQSLLIRKRLDGEVEAPGGIL
jgi:hypothetical protein